MTRHARFDRDYYTLMGLDAEATEDDIRRAYRRLALQWHPDRNPGNAEAPERFKQISEAYAVLIDPAKRREYDATRQWGATGEFRRSRDDLFRDLFADPRASAVFEELAREFARLGVRVDRQYFHRTLFGGRAVIAGGVFVISPLTPVLALLRVARALMGSAAPAPGAQRAGILRTIGRVGRWLLGTPAGQPAIAAEDVVIPLRLTPTEAERGGRKRVSVDGAARELLVTVPPGIRAGARLRLRGGGRTRADGARGDLYLTVEIDQRD